MDGDAQVSWDAGSNGCLVLDVGEVARDGLYFYADSRSMV